MLRSLRRLATLSLPIGVLLAAPPVTNAQSANLILNPGNDLPLVAGEIPGWVEVVGLQWTQGVDLGAHSPPYFFRAGNVKNGELAQYVDVSAYASLIDAGVQTFSFNGFVRSFAQDPTDSARVVVEYLPLNGLPLAVYDSGEQTVAGIWYPLADTRSAPPGTRWIRVRLIATRYAGTGNGGFFDSLSLVAHAPSSWFDLGSGLAGVAGIPSLVGAGSLAAGSPVALELTHAAPLAPTLLLVSASNNPTPFLGGTLATVPVSVQVPVTTYLTGTWTLQSSWPAGVPTGFAFYFQAIALDASAVQGVSISNLLKATQP